MAYNAKEIPASESAREVHRSLEFIHSIKLRQGDGGAGLKLSLNSVVARANSNIEHQVGGGGGRGEKGINHVVLQ